MAFRIGFDFGAFRGGMGLGYPCFIELQYTPRKRLTYLSVGMWPKMGTVGSPEVVPAAGEYWGRVMVVQGSPPAFDGSDAGAYSPANDADTISNGNARLLYDRNFDLLVGHQANLALEIPGNTNAYVVVAGPQHMTDGTVPNGHVSLTVLGDYVSDNALEAGARNMKLR